MFNLNPVSSPQSLSAARSRARKSDERTTYHLVIAAQRDCRRLDQTGQDFKSEPASRTTCSHQLSAAKHRHHKSTINHGLPIGEDKLLDLSPPVKSNIRCEPPTNLLSALLDISHRLYHMDEPGLRLADRIRMVDSNLEWPFVRFSLHHLKHRHSISVEYLDVAIFCPPSGIGNNNGPARGSPHPGPD